MPPSDDRFTQSVYKKQLRTEMESGLVRSRVRHTKARRKFTLGWKAMTQTEYDNLVTFFTTNIGTIFMFYHPLPNPQNGSAVTYQVRFTEDELPEVSHAGFRDGEIAWSMTGLQIEEV